MICPLSPAHLVALGAFQLFVLFLFIDPRLAPIPLILFVVICAITPFLPRLSFFLPIISRGKAKEDSVALTCDDGPDPLVTPLLLDLLDRHGVAATFFVTGHNADKYPDLIRSILARGHAIGNHSYNHSPFLMLKGSGTLRQEIASAQATLKGFGIVPLAFRPPVGITSPRLWRILLEEGMFCVNFSCRAGDRGNRSVIRLAERLLRKVTGGDIILLHDVSPHQGDVSHLLAQFEKLILGLRARGMDILPLSQLIGREIMEREEGTGGLHPAELFYNGLAAEYDTEQFCSNVSISRSREYDLFTSRLPELLDKGSRVLEIGAGTGIFTITIAQHCQEVVAVDISANMLKMLEEKARQHGVKNIRIVKGNVETMELDGPFAAVCAFLSLEYLSDAGALFRRLHSQVEPGGIIYFTIARRSLFRFFIQLGNAMRQGMWLKAHSRKGLTKMLRAAGFEPVSIESHLLKSWFCRGMLLEVVARRAATVAGTAVAARKASHNGLVE